MADVYMLLWTKMPNGESKVVSVRAVQNDIGDQGVRQVLVVHALTGCYTTSAIFGRSRSWCIFEDCHPQ